MIVDQINHPFAPGLPPGCMTIPPGYARMHAMVPTPQTETWVSGFSSRVSVLGFRDSVLETTALKPENRNARAPRAYLVGLPRMHPPTYREPS